MGCNLCGVSSSGSKSALCNECDHGLCSRFYDGCLTPRVYSWLRVSGYLVNGLMFDPRKFFTALLQESVYHRTPKYVQTAMALLLENSNGYYGRFETFRSLSEMEPLVNYMVVKSDSDKLHFGAVIWTLDKDRSELSCLQEDANYSISEDDLIPSSLVCIRVTNDSHELPDLSYLFCGEGEDCE